MFELAQAHPTESAIEEYVLERLAGQELDEFEEHLLVCELCQDRLAEADGYVAAMKSATGRLQQERPLFLSRRPHRKWFEMPAWLTRPAWGAALAAAVLTLVIWIPRPGDDPHHAQVLLRAMRGPEAVWALAPAGRPFVIQADLTDSRASGILTLEIVDAQGREVWRTSAEAEAATLPAPVTRKLAEGRYWVRVSDAEGRLLREYGLEAR